MKKRSQTVILKPAQCVLLGIDSAKVSGYSIYEGRPTPTAYGLASTASERQEVVARAASLGRSRGLQVVIGAEDWSPGFKSHRATLGTGAGWGRWEQVIELEGLSRNVLRVEMNEWRKQVLSPDPKMKRDQLKELALQSAKLRKLLSPDEQSHDVAEAVLIGLYFLYAQETHDLLESIPRRRS